MVNDEIVLFYMRGRKVYLNTLRSRCFGLAREKRFSYTVHTGQLCERDRLHVLQDSSFGMQDGRSCALGRFQPISREDAEALLNPQPEPPPKTPLETPPIEEVVAPPAPEE